MIRTATLLLAALGLASPFATAQQPSAPARAAQAKRDQGVYSRAEALVHAEQVRAGQPICPHSANNDDYNICVGKERDLTDADEVQLVRALGVLVRAGTEGQKPTPGPLAFDQAEATWHVFRTQLCDALGTLYQGGSEQSSLEIVCEITATRQHMDALWAVFKDALQQ